MAAERGVCDMRVMILEFLFLRHDTERSDTLGIEVINARLFG